MTINELLTKYRIRDHHKVWDPAVDNFMSVEIYRETHAGQLPSPNDQSCLYILEFIEKAKNRDYFFGLENPGSKYATALRMIYRYADKIVRELNNQAQEGK